MGFYVGFMGFDGGFMGFYGGLRTSLDLMGCYPLVNKLSELENYHVSMGKSTMFMVIFSS